MRQSVWDRTRLLGAAPFPQPRRQRWKTILCVLMVFSLEMTAEQRYLTSLPANIGTGDKSQAPGWNFVGFLRLGRYEHSATLLQNGKVLFVGGKLGTALASSELYHPSTGRVFFAASMSTGRYGHTATHLPSGEVLVVGGRSSEEELLGSAEIYDPKTDQWKTSQDSLAHPRSHHTATLLPSGHVLIAGGSDHNGPLISTEIYDPENDLWTTSHSLPAARSRHTSTLLPTGHILFVGGQEESLVTDLYDPATGISIEDNLNAPKVGNTATLLRDGRVLIVDNGAEYPAEIYTPGDGWSIAAEPAIPRSNHTATLLPTDEVLIAGGLPEWNTALNDSELYDPATNQWTSGSSMSHPTFDHTAVLLPSGEVLVVGGSDGDTLNSAEIFDPSTGSWRAAQLMNQAREQHHVRCFHERQAAPRTAQAPARRLLPSTPPRGGAA